MVEFTNLQMVIDSRPGLLFLYDLGEFPVVPFNYHKAAALAGFHVIVAPWESTVDSSDGIRISEGFELTSDGQATPLTGDTFAFRVLIHRAWGDCEPRIKQQSHYRLRDDTRRNAERP